QAGYGYVPYSSLESVIEQNKESYYLTLRRTQGTLRSESPDWTPWLTFFLQCLQKQKRRLAEKLERENLMRSSLGEAAVSILELVTQHGEVSVGDIINSTGMARATAKKRVNELVESGHLERRGKGRGTRYIRAQR
ncbi:MAG: DeoR family transcriptional regulator, partial [Candidatus Eisenbacteria bacterium]|nr:DeoR family transcriptional regulator [Candidatus Eisenbacteria bacterium]